MTKEIDKTAIIDMLNKVEWEGSDYWVTEYADLDKIPDKRTKELVDKIRKLYEQLEKRFNQLRDEVEYRASYE